ncbi:UNVERIFIED_CONTAM: hypothetical protein GTU68_049978, partial [Idotea baltica]|nr:hypothetical protein [Idotea baltica]
TNIITGFLGVGKTSTILHLLKDKPVNESWAILVNEFGEIGVDGSLLEDNGVTIREVPGGCMCCAAGVPMQIALNQLLKSANPDRLLIEPTGLGHPKEVLEILSSEHYQEVLSVQKTLTLVDARKLSDNRYTSHDTFNQQIAIADTIIGNKSDLYKEDDQQKLIAYIKQNNTQNAKVILSQHGDINTVELEGKTATILKSAKHHHLNNSKPLLSDVPLPECGFIKAVNNGEGFHSIGWRFSQDTIFDYKKLTEFVWNTEAERVKAVFNTNRKIIGFNFDQDILTEVELDNCTESRIEIILESISNSNDWDEKLEHELMKCILV